MPKADFIAKLRQVEELANAVVAELSPGVAHTRVQHIVVLVKTLRGRLEFGNVAARQRAASRVRSGGLGAGLMGNEAAMRRQWACPARVNP